MDYVNLKKPESSKRASGQKIIVYGFLIVIILCGAYFRLVGVNWDENRHLHPDERFLSMVQASITPVVNAGGYFDTESSTLNPANTGYDFFVYGTLPIFLIRYIGEAIGQTGYDSITILGRHLSAIADLVTIFIVFLIGRRLYQDKVGLIAAALYSFSVLPIQLSHFMTVDSFTNTFGMLTVYLGVWVATKKKHDIQVEGITQLDTNKTPFGMLLQELFPYILFGAFLGMAAASKINAITLALILPIIEGIRFFTTEKSNRTHEITLSMRNLIVAAFFSFVTFRIFQPYAFNGPGFFNLGINQQWWASLQSLRSQAAGDVDFPPALQWARRPLTFAWTNMVVWGMGLPFGIMSWIAYIGMGWRIFRKKTLKHLPLWLWTGFYFSWQAFAWVRSMRYQMLVYPLFAIITAWGLVALWDYRNNIKIWFVSIQAKVIRVVGIVLSMLIILGSVTWAFAFTRIYSRPHSRVAASEWIYQNIPGPINLVIDTEGGVVNQPLPFRSGDVIKQGESYIVPFRPMADSILSEIKLPKVVDQNNLDEIQQVSISILADNLPYTRLASASVERSFIPADSGWQGDSVNFVLEPAIKVYKNEIYFLEVALELGNGNILLNGSPELELILQDGSFASQMLPKITQTIKAGVPYSMDIVVMEKGELQEVTIPRLLDMDLEINQKSLVLRLAYNENGENKVVESTLRDDFSEFRYGKGADYTFKFNETIPIRAIQPVTFTLEIVEGDGRLAVSSQAPVHESSWDDALPLSLEGFYPYSDNGGIYRGDLNFEMYWPDDVSKRTRFETNLDQADYIFISSNRQWGTTTRVPERYPLTSAYYRNLLGCPEEKSIIWCYNVAKPGMYAGQLGFDLVAVFESYPNLGNWDFNSQFAEEAFTVYDAPKVLIFQKTSEYDPLVVHEILQDVDLSQVVNITAKQADNYQPPTLDGNPSPKTTLLLPEDDLLTQRENGTWSELFDRNAVINTNPVLAVIALYLFITLLGFLVYPMVRLALPGLVDKGYAFTKLVGMLLLAYIVWLAGSVGINITKPAIAVALAVIGLAGIILYIVQRKEIKEDVKRNWRYFIVIEILALLAFGLLLYIRIGNPDLWHPYKGGEKPMDFSYFNAILKSSTFPPYDPWFAGGYINYYYYGLLVVAIPIKLLGIIPSTAYNIILPILFSLLFIGSFSVGWNLYKGIRLRKEVVNTVPPRVKLFSGAFWTGLGTAILLSILGNLGTIQLLINSFQKLGSGGLPIEDGNFIQSINWTVQGFTQFLKKVPLPLYPGDWYWIPSRAIPGEAITEFPFFTFIYGDLHAHLIALPMVVFSLAWGLSILFARGVRGTKDGKFKILTYGFSFFIGALVIGGLKPTNTWDYYTYLLLNLIILGFVSWKYYKPSPVKKSHLLVRKVIYVFAPLLILVALTQGLFIPFNQWFGQGFTEAGLWLGDKTPITSYLVHWGLFLIVIISWLFSETYNWLAETPISALKKLKELKPFIIISAVLILSVLLGLFAMKVFVGLIIIPLGIWSAILLFRAKQPDGKRLILFLIGTALTLTLVVELVYLIGDIGRMNVVFKLYNQAWVLFALSAGFCVVSLIESLPRWNVWKQFLWQLIFFSLIISTALFPLLGATDKIADRMAEGVPNTLDGMAYMEYATYYDMGVVMDLSEDYWAIRWMQDNIEGSPVILEGQAYEYRWGNRYTIYTGLPGVVGWNWHQRQQRAILRSNVVQERVDQVGQFYISEDRTFVESYIKQYDVSYIVFGQLERAFYPGQGLDKFEAMDGILWDEVYRYASTVIYKVK
ncbi:MAG: DUF2298 domain-containing protein [Anaerolineaceae bacterium]|nr:DUF2298 domain-containing protein [Anaerolineaceae bacterium]